MHFFPILRRIVMPLFLFCISFPVWTFEKQIVLGRDDNWDGFQALDNLLLVVGRWSYLDVVLKDAEYEELDETDLIIHFNDLPIVDVSDNYEVTNKDVVISRNLFVFREGSGVFTGGANGIILTPQKSARFAPDTYWEDFSFELWLYAALLNDGELLLSWTGSRWEDDKIIPQRIQCVIEQRRLRWVFENFFIPTGGAPYTITLTGLTALIPRVWNHHLLRFDMNDGLLEYLVDGIPEDVRYATVDKKYGGDICIPYIGYSAEDSLIVGSGLTGYIDELSFRTSFVSTPQLSKYRGITGVGISQVFDLGYSGTRLKRITAEFHKPGDSEIHFYYRISNHLETSETLPTDWIQVIPGTDLMDTRGRYVQIRIELFPDGKRELTPELSEITIVFEPDLPPGAPTIVRAEPGDGMVRVLWNRVNEQDVKGYLLFYGSSPEHYLGTDSDKGASPIDVGNVNSIELSGLENGKLYYFAVAAYDSSYPPHRSDYSEEVSVRPSGIHK